MFITVQSNCTLLGNIRLFTNEYRPVFILVLSDVKILFMTYTENTISDSKHILEKYLESPQQIVGKCATCQTLKSKILGIS